MGLDQWQSSGAEYPEGFPTESQRSVQSQGRKVTRAHLPPGEGGPFSFAPGVTSVTAFGQRTEATFLAMCSCRLLDDNPYRGRAQALDVCRGQVSYSLAGQSQESCPAALAPSSDLILQVLSKAGPWLLAGRGGWCFPGWPVGRCCSHWIWGTSFRPFTRRPHQHPLLGAALPSQTGFEVALQIS